MFESEGGVEAHIVDQLVDPFTRPKMLLYEVTPIAARPWEYIRRFNNSYQFNFHFRFHFQFHYHFQFAQPWENENTYYVSKSAITFTVTFKVLGVNLLILIQNFPIFIQNVSIFFRCLQLKMPIIIRP